MPGGHTSDGEYAILNPQMVSASVSVSLNTSSVVSSLLPVGGYEAICSSACWLRQGGASVSATTASPSHYVAANTVKPFYVASASDGYIAGILGGGSATLVLNRL